MSRAPLRVVALISGRGSNLQAILDRVADGTLAARVCAVISNRADAAGLERARAAGSRALVLSHRDYPDRDRYDQALAELIEAQRPDLVVLAGFMRVLTPAFVQRFHGRVINIHPSLLPALRGVDTHARALAAGLTEHGASVHYVSAELDGGPLIACARVPVLADDDADRLAARVLGEEHRLYPAVIDWIASGRLTLVGDTPTLDGKPLGAPVDLTRENVH